MSRSPVSRQEWYLRYDRTVGCLNRPSFINGNQVRRVLYACVRVSPVHPTRRQTGGRPTRYKCPCTVIVGEIFCIPR
jgi:hypothetical protein